MGEIVHPDFGATRRVTLARESSFTVGRLTVDPPTRQISFRKQQQTVEPRVMQVLVALARADGGVVSKDELFDSCWDGRIVGEDAINRVIHRIRQIAQDLGGGSFQIGTIRGVGYRLVEVEPSVSADETVPDARTDTSPAFSRRAVLTASVSVGAAAAGAAFWLLPRKAAHQPAPLALQYYQQGLNTRGQNSLELAERGVALFRQATRIDPEYADAWGALAWSYRELAENGARPDPDPLRALARSAAARALELDPDNADAHAALLLLRPYYRNWAAIDSGCRRLLERHPGHSDLEYNFAVNLTQVGRWREAIPYFRSVSERERFWPLPHIDWSHALMASGRLEEAGDLLEDGISRFPRHEDYWLTKVRYLALAGRPREAVDYASGPENLPAGWPMHAPEIQAEIALSRALAERSQELAKVAAERFTDMARQYPGRTGFVASALLLLGAHDTAFSMFDGYFFGEGPWASGRSDRAVTGRLFTPPAVALQREARFARLLHRTGLEHYWQRTGTAPDFRRFPVPEYRLPIGQSSVRGHG